MSCYSTDGKTKPGSQLAVFKPKISPTLHRMCNVWIHYTYGVSLATRNDPDEKMWFRVLLYASECKSCVVDEAKIRIFQKYAKSNIGALSNISLEITACSSRVFNRASGVHCGTKKSHTVGWWLYFFFFWANKCHAEPWNNTITCRTTTVDDPDEHRESTANPAKLSWVASEIAIVLTLNAKECNKKNNH